MVRNCFSSNYSQIIKNFLTFHSSLLLVYEGKDADTDRFDSSNHYDADISNCSTDLNASHDNSHDHHNQCSSNDENDGGIGHEDESNMDHCLYDEEERRARDSGNGEDIDKEQNETKFLKMPNNNRPVSPHSMDSWLNYSNSSDEYSSQDVIVRKGTKLNLHDDESTQDTEDVDVYDKINFVNAKSISSFKKSKIDGETASSTATSTINPFNFTSSCSTKASECDLNASKLAHETDDGIEVELEEEEDDDQLSSLSSNIDTIIVSETGETKFFSVSGEQEEHPSVKKKKSTTSEDEKLPMTNGNHTPKLSSSSSSSSSPLVDVRIIDFANATFSTDSPTMSTTKTVQHHGPDGGFLTGVESLKRILSEIIAESI